MTLPLSRRASCIGGGLAALTSFAPSHLVFASPAFAATATDSVRHPDYLRLRGAVAGEHAILRTSGLVFAGANDGVPSWRFIENTQVSWTASAAGGVVERREGRIQIAPANGGKVIEIATGPIIEQLSFDPQCHAAIYSAGSQNLILSEAPLSPSQAWQILDHPQSASQMPEIADFRMFRMAKLGTPSRQVFWALRSPWLPELGPAPETARLSWSGQGFISVWNGADAISV